MMLLLLLLLLAQELPILVLDYTNVGREEKRERKKMDNRC